MWAFDVIFKLNTKSYYDGGDTPSFRIKNIQDTACFGFGLVNDSGLALGVTTSLKSSAQFQCTSYEPHVTQCLWLSQGRLTKCAKSAEAFGKVSRKEFGL